MWRHRRSTGSTLSTGKRTCEATFTVQVAGPNVTSGSSTSLGFNISWKDKAELVEAGGEAGWTVSRSHSSQAAGAWSRRLIITGGSGMSPSQDSAWKEDLDGEMEVDDDDGHDGWGPDTDWHLHTYDGSSDF